MHKVQPNQHVIIIQLEIAVPAFNDNDNIVRDEISALLSEHGIANPDSNILDWQYTRQERYVTAPGDPLEGDVFLPEDTYPRTEVNHEIH